MRIFFLILISVFLFITCRQTVEQSDSTEQEQPKIEELTFENTEFNKSQNALLLAKSRIFKRGFRDANYGFLLESKKGEKSFIKIQSTGLEQEFNKSFEMEGQLVDAYFMDLNNDNLKELYLIFQGTDDSGNLEIKGISPNQKNGASTISIDDTNMIRSVNSDKIFVKENHLYRTFISDETTYVFDYILSNEDSAYLLKAKKN